MSSNSVIALVVGSQTSPELLVRLEAALGSDAQILHCGPEEPVNPLVSTVVDLSWPHSLAGDHETALVALRKRVESVPETTDPVHYVFLSSVFVYGAWADNPHPLTESDEPRADDEAEAFVDLIKAERLLQQRFGSRFQDENFEGHLDKKSLCVLRCAPVVTPQSSGWTYIEFSGLTKADLIRNEREVQFVHLDDLAAAIQLAVFGKLVGAFNLAPVDSISIKHARELVGRFPALDLPETILNIVKIPARSLGVLGIAAHYESYLQHSVVVSNSRLCAAGWQLQYSSAEALVACAEGSWWSRLSPKRRQEMAIGVAGVSVVGAIAMFAAAMLRLRRKR